MESSLIHSLDVAFDTWLNAYRMSPWTAVFIWFTHWGAGPTLVAVMTTASGFVYVTGRRLLLLPLWLGFAGAELLTWSLKYAVARARPEFLLGVTAQSPSFPSAHAAGAAVVYGLVACVLLHSTTKPQQRQVTLVVAITLILLIGFSRIYLNVHYLSDVIVGWLIGAAGTGLTWSWIRRI